MKTRLFSFLTVVCMLLSLLPSVALAATAAEAQPNAGFETVFSVDANNPNFPTLALPEAADGATYVALGKYNFSGIPAGGRLDNAITYNGNWQLGALKVTWDTETDAVTFGAAFAPYTTLRRDTVTDLAIAGSTPAWMSTAAPSGGGLFLVSSLSSTLTAPIDYTKVEATPDAPNADPRNADVYEATTAVRYTAPYSGVISLDVLGAFAYDNGIDVVILHNGEEIAVIENDGTKTVGLGADVKTAFDFGRVVDMLTVEQGDTVDIVMRADPTYDYEQMGEAFSYAQTKRGMRNFEFTVTYEDGWTYIDYDALYYTATWDQGDASLLNIVDRDALNDIPKFYVWYDESGAPKVVESIEHTLVDTDYAMINPVLFEEGILTEDMTWEEKWDAYGAHLATRGVVTFSGDFTVGNLVNGEYQLLGARVFTHPYSVYGCYRNGEGFEMASNRWGYEFVASTAVAMEYLADTIAKGKQAMQPNAEGKLYYAEIKDICYTDVACTIAYKNTSGHGGFYFRNGVYALRPNTNEPVALTYTVPEGIYGTAYVDLEEYLNTCGMAENDGLFAIMHNGEVVWPAGARPMDYSTWYPVNTTTVNLKELTRLLSDVKMEVKAGDEIRICLARGNVGTKKITADIKPAIRIEKKFVVEFLDASGEVMSSELVRQGAAMVTPPLATNDGYYVNGSTEKVDTLPETVEEHLRIQYAGDFVFNEVKVEKVNIAVGRDFAVSLYLRGDEYAERVGLVTDDIADTWGEKQADGTYKVTLTGIAARDLARSVDVYIFQEFKGGHNENNSDVYVLNATDILKTYTEDPAYADYKELASAALDYAAAADAYFNGTALDAEVEARLAAQDAAIAALSKDIAAEEGFYDYSIYASTVVLKDQVAIKLQVTLAEIDNLNEDILGFTVLVEDENGEGMEFDGFNYQVGSDMLNEGIPTAAVITLNGMDPSAYGKTWRIKVMDGFAQQSAAISYSVNTYIARTFEGGAGETDNLLRALYALGVAANAN